jgi:hypothetical protein
MHWHPSKVAVYVSCVGVDDVSSRQAYNFQQINAEDRTYAYQQQSTRETTGLLESPNEVTIKVNGITASALLDTGSTVSTVSESFYLQYLAKQSIQTLDRILHIECANGEEMPYLGYITVRAEAVIPLTFMVTSLGLPNSPVVSLVDCCW